MKDTGICSCDEAEDRTPNGVKDERRPREFDGPGAAIDSLDMITRVLADELERDNDDRETNSEEEINHIAARTMALQVLLGRIGIRGVGQESTNADSRARDADREHVLEPGVDVAVAIASPPRLNVLGSPDFKLVCNSKGRKY